MRRVVAIVVALILASANPAYADKITVEYPEQEGRRFRAERIVQRALKHSSYPYFEEWPETFVYFGPCRGYGGLYFPNENKACVSMMYAYKPLRGGSRWGGARTLLHELGHASDWHRLTAGEEDEIARAFHPDTPDLHSWWGGSWADRIGEAYAEAWQMAYWAKTRPWVMTTHKPNENVLALIRSANEDSNTGEQPPSGPLVDPHGDPLVVAQETTGLVFIYPEQEGRRRRAEALVKHALDHTAYAYFEEWPQTTIAFGPCAGTYNFHTDSACIPVDFTLKKRHWPEGQTLDDQAWVLLRALGHASDDHRLDWKKRTRIYDQFHHNKADTHAWWTGEDAVYLDYADAWVATYFTRAEWVPKRPHMWHPGVARQIRIENATPAES